MRYEYDELNRLTRTFDAGSWPPTSGRSVETVQYDRNGNVGETTLRDGRVIVRTFDALNRVTGVYYDSYHYGILLQTFTYDKQSRLTIARDTNDDLDAAVPGTAVTYSTEYTYDFAGRVEEEAAFPGTNRATAPRAHAVKTAYAVGNPLNGDSRVVTKDYIADATPATPTVKRSFTYTEDLRGLLGKVESMGVTDASYSYDDNGRLSTQVLGGASTGHTLALAYDARGREATRNYTRNASGVSSFRQATAYDKASNVKSEAVADQIDANPVAHAYAYDAQHRLSEDADSSDPSNNVTWAHDTVGNWKQSNQNNPAVTEDFTVNIDNEYTDVDTSTSQKPHAYDARGNLTNTGNPASPVTGDQRFTYDWADRLTKVEERVASGGGSWLVKAEYFYDALNRRVDKRYTPNLAAPGQSRWEFFVYDGDRVVMELYDPDFAGIPATILTARSFAYNSYIDAPLLLVDEEGDVQLGGIRKKGYYLQDRRFGVAALANESGAIVERVRYEAFGAMTVYALQTGVWTPRPELATPKPNASAFNNPYGFTGRRYDAETATSTSAQGLWHYRNRMYSSRLGRFLQRDPAGYVDGFNLYAYVRNNPLAFVDAFGLRRESNIFNTIGSGITNTLSFLSNGPNVKQLASGVNRAVTSTRTVLQQLSGQFDVFQDGLINQGVSETDARNRALSAFRSGTLSNSVAVSLGLAFEQREDTIEILMAQEARLLAIRDSLISSGESNLLGPVIPIPEVNEIFLKSHRDAFTRNTVQINLNTAKGIQLRQEQDDIRQAFSALGLDRIRITSTRSVGEGFFFFTDGFGFKEARRAGRNIQRVDPGGLRSSGDDVEVAVSFPPSDGRGEMVEDGVRSTAL